MYETKTKPTSIKVDSYIETIDNEERRLDCQALIQMMSEVTREAPVMWGPSIVGFGSYHYKYDSGHEGDACVLGFSSRKGDISIYTNLRLEDKESELKKLGRNKAGKSCLYIKRLADVDQSVLKHLLECGMTEIKRRYP